MVIYAGVQVTLTSSDASGVDRIEYSLDAGNTWQVYEAPFTIEPGDIPEIPYEFEGDSFAGTPGTHLILAYAIDGAGNAEDPPAYRSFAINPDADPNKASPTPLYTPTATPTPTSTTVPVCTVEFTLSMNAHCRSGTGTSFPVQTTFLSGTKLVVDGRNEAGTWFFVQRPTSLGHCWVAVSTGDTVGDVACLTV
jgi:hypothetical protein